MTGKNHKKWSNPEKGPLLMGFAITTESDDEKKIVYFYVFGIGVSILLN